MIKSRIAISFSDLRRYDPLRLGDTSDDSLQDGILKGLSTLRNLTNFDVSCDENDLIVFSTTLGMKNANVHYKWTRKFVFTFSGTMWMRVSAINFQLEVAMNRTAAVSFHVTKVLITKLDGFEVGFTGLGLLNPVIRGVINVLSKICKSTTIERVASLIESALEGKLEEVAPTIDIPKF